jgi:beta-xylosidase
MDRRTSLKVIGAAGTAAAFPSQILAQGSRASSSLDPYASMHWGHGFEGQRRADLGNGTFLNPVFAGDHPDPSIIRDGDDYYVTFSSFDAYPGIVIWHSRDLVNWRPVTAALKTPVGSVWAPGLVKHGDRFYCYIPAHYPDKRSIYVIHAERIEGPWSEPIDLHLPNHIDPSHIVDEQGRRWLFLSGGDRVQLSPDGLSTVGAPQHVYDPWHYPEDWVVEGFSPEGPKVVRRGDFYYIVTAVGGTAGPPTSHMVIVARSRSLAGPWENDPENPVVHTSSALEKWWSRGHATLFEGPGDRWWMIYHGYENGYWTLGRQTLLEPIEWTADGWPRALGGDLSKPLRKPFDLGPQPHGFPLSDDFSTNKFGIEWGFYAPAPNEMERIRRANGAMFVRGKGASPSDCSPISCIVGDQRYKVECDIEVGPENEAGLLLFYNHRLYAGLGFSSTESVMHRYGEQRRGALLPGMGGRIRMRITNDRNILTIHTSADGGASWRKYEPQMEVSGYHHNVAGDFLSLRPALYSAKSGEARFSNFTYMAL